MNKSFLYALGALAVYTIYRRYSNKTPVYYVDSIAANFNARTIPPLGIFIKKSQKNNTALLKHELIHWNQFKNLGLLGFYTTYISEHIKNGYDLNRLEIEARKNESNYCRNNFTACVRSGESKTVYNPNFRK
jgi:hypothetical protein